MKLQFSEEINGKKTNFRDKIINAEKIQAICKDKENIFKKGVDLELFVDDTLILKRKCLSVQEIEIFCLSDLSILIYIDIFPLLDSEVHDLSIYQGFDSVDEFINYFTKESKENYKGKIIHWTHLKY